MYRIDPATNSAGKQIKVAPPQFAPLVPWISPNGRTAWVATMNINSGAGLIDNDSFHPGTNCRGPRPAECHHRQRRSAGGPARQLPAGLRVHGSGARAVVFASVADRMACVLPHARPSSMNVNVISSS